MKQKSKDNRYYNDIMLSAFMNKNKDGEWTEKPEFKEEALRQQKWLFEQFEKFNKDRDFDSLVSSICAQLVMSRLYEEKLYEVSWKIINKEKGFA